MRWNVHAGREVLSCPRNNNRRYLGTAFSFVNLYDGSTLSQIAANYYLSDRWTLGAYVSANLGSPRSERGSFPQEASAILQLVRYF